jgi:hypothetical protein
MTENEACLLYMTSHYQDSLMSLNVAFEIHVVTATESIYLHMHDKKLTGSHGRLAVWFGSLMFWNHFSSLPLNDQYQAYKRLSTNPAKIRGKVDQTVC